MQITTGKYHTLLINDNSAYSCGSSLCGVLGHGPVTTQREALTRVNFPSKSCVVHLSASHNHAGFVMQSGEVSNARNYVCIHAWWSYFTIQLLIQVFTCGDNSSFCCGLGELRRTIFKPTRVEALKGIPCKQVRTV